MGCSTSFKTTRMKACLPVSLTLVLRGGCVSAPHRLISTASKCLWKSVTHSPQSASLNCECYTSWPEQLTTLIRSSHSLSMRIDSAQQVTRNSSCPQEASHSLQVSAALETPCTLIQNLPSSFNPRSAVTSSGCTFQLSQSSLHFPFHSALPQGLTQPAQRQQSAR